MYSEVWHQFRLGPWQVEPARGALTGPNGEKRHLQPKVMDVLVLLAKHHGQLVSRDQLLDEVWGGQIAADELLTGAVSELRRALRDDRGNPQFVETIPKRGYRLVGPVYPPDGSGLEISATRVASITASKQYKLALLILFAIVVVAVPFAWDSYHDRSIEANTIAVLPFANLTGDPAQSWLSDGITVQILNSLGEISGLKLVGRKSSFRFRGDNLDLRDVGADLGVETILEGTVRRDGNSLRIVAQLVNAADGFEIWSGSYDRTVDDLLETQDDIARSVVRALKPHLEFDLAVARPDRIQTTSDAYAEYLQGLHFLDRIFAPGQKDTDLDAPQRALDHMQRATELAPEFAMAWAGRARALVWQTSLLGGSWEEPEPLIDEWLDKALALGADIAEVQYAAGDWTDGAEAIAHLERAIDTNPNYAEAYTTLAQKFLFSGRYRDYFQAAAKAVELDPLDNWADWIALYAAFHQGKITRLEERLIKDRELWPTSNALADEVHLRFELGQFEHYPALQARADALGPDFAVEPPNWITGTPRYFGDGYLTLGLVDPARRFLEWRYRDVIDLYVGDSASAIEFLEGELQESRDARSGNYRTFRDVLSSLVESYLYAAQYAQIVETMDDFNFTPDLPGLPYPEFTNPPWPQVAYVFAQFQLGNDDIAERQLNALVTQLEDRLAQGVSVPNHYYELARMRAMQGRNNDALAALQRAIDMGWRRWYFDRDPVLAPVRRLPEFAVLKDRYEADLANKRRLVQQLLVNSGLVQAF